MLKKFRFMGTLKEQFDAFLDKNVHLGSELTKSLSRVCPLGMVRFSIYFAVESSLREISYVGNVHVLTCAG